jgi:hypothetical protein
MRAEELEPQGLERAVDSPPALRGLRSGATIQSFLARL